MDRKYFSQWISPPPQRGLNMCCVLILFHYLNIVLLSLSLSLSFGVCALFGLREKKMRRRVFIIFIDAIINDWCLLVWWRACNVHVMCVYAWKFTLLISFVWSYSMRNAGKKWMAKILLVFAHLSHHMNHKTRHRDFWILRQFSTTLNKKKKKKKTF